MAKNDPTGRTAPYRLLAANGRLLYVGIAGNPDSRWGQHSTQQKWWADVVDRKVEWFPDRAAAAAAEVAAIKTERPLHNIQHAVVEKPVIPAQADDEWPPAPDFEKGDRLPFARLFDEQAERRLLGSMLRSGRAIRDARAIVDVHDLHAPGNQAVFYAIACLADEGEMVDPITVESKLMKLRRQGRVGGTPYTRDLHSSVASGSNAPQYAGIVRTLAITRRWAEVQAKAKD